MTTLKEIETAIEKLPREEFFALTDWVRTRSGDEWDRQIEDDLKAGRLDHLALHARKEFLAGKTSAFPGK
ncbi:MAG: hypothetical protein RRC34_15960 [Lentisphaeria bacterium]|nr:hypothetical protein [Lentisphaeria bacterium]